MRFAFGGLLAPVLAAKADLRYLQAQCASLTYFTGTGRAASRPRARASTVEARSRGARESRRRSCRPNAVAVRGLPACARCAWRDRHDVNPIREQKRLVDVVSDEDHRALVLFPHAHEDLVHRDTGLGVEARRTARSPSAGPWAVPPACGPPRPAASCRLRAGRETSAHAPRVRPRAARRGRVRVARRAAGESASARIRHLRAR